MTISEIQPCYPRYPVSGYSAVDINSFAEFSVRSDSAEFQSILRYKANSVIEAINDGDSFIYEGQTGDKALELLVEDVCCYLPNKPLKFLGRIICGGESLTIRSRGERFLRSYIELARQVGLTISFDSKAPNDTDEFATPYDADGFLGALKSFVAPRLLDLQGPALIESFKRGKVAPQISIYALVRMLQSPKHATDAILVGPVLSLITGNEISLDLHTMEYALPDEIELASYYLEQVGSLTQKMRLRRIVSNKLNEATVLTDASLLKKRLERIKSNCGGYVLKRLKFELGYQEMKERDFNIDKIQSAQIAESLLIVYNAMVKTIAPETAIHKDEIKAFVEILSNLENSGFSSIVKALTDCFEEANGIKEENPNDPNYPEWWKKTFPNENVTKGTWSVIRINGLNIWFCQYYTTSNQYGGGKKKEEATVIAIESVKYLSDRGIINRPGLDSNLKEVKSPVYICKIGNGVHKSVKAEVYSFVPLPNNPLYQAYMESITADLITRESRVNVVPGTPNSKDYAENGWLLDKEPDPFRNQVVLGPRERVHARRLKGNEIATVRKLLRRKRPDQLPVAN